MKQEDVDLIKAEIKQKIKKLISEIEQLEESVAPVAPENAIGRISRMDAINNKSVVEASLLNRKKKLSKLQLALAKADQPAFGICSRCKKIINPKRLILMPESDKCIRCA